MVKLKNEKIKTERFAAGFAIIECRSDIFLLSEEQEIFCKDCFENMIKSYEIFPNYNEKIVTVLLNFPYECSKCKRKILPQETLIIEK